MKNFTYALLFGSLIMVCSCYSVDTSTSSAAPGVKHDDSRFHVSLVDGEICSADSMSNAVYCESSDESRVIEVTIIVKYTSVNGVPVQENKVVIVQPGQKVYVGCPRQGNGDVFYMYEIAVTRYM